MEKYIDKNTFYEKIHELEGAIHKEKLHSELMENKVRILDDALKLQTVMQDLNNRGRLPVKVMDLISKDNCLILVLDNSRRIEFNNYATYRNTIPADIFEWHLFKYRMYLSWIFQYSDIPAYELRLFFKRPFRKRVEFSIFITAPDNIEVYFGGNEI